MTGSATTRDDVWLAVLAHRERAVRVARSRCASPQDVDDVVQEAMLRVAAMPSVELSRVGPLLTTVVANLITDSRRSAATAARAKEKLIGWQVPLPGPDEDVCDELAARWLWSRREVLSHQDRRVLELRVEGLAPDDVARRLGLTLKAVEASFTRARSGLRKAWKAAAAVAGGLWCQVPRSSESTAVAVVAATAVVAVVALQTPADDLRTSAPEVRPAPVPVLLVEAPPPPARRGLGMPPVPPAALDAQPARPRPAPAVARAPSVVAQSGAVRVAHVHTGGVRVERDDEEESFAETVQRCLREGLHLSPSHVECRG